MVTSAAKKLSIVIPARNEAETLPEVLASCRKMSPYEIIVVANGCRDDSIRIAGRMGCKVIVEKDPLGNDVGRAIGASAASGDLILFLDADFAIPAERLISFVRPAATGRADVVLNDLDELFVEKKSPHSTTVWRQVFNALIRREDLNIDSLLSVPHVLTQRALRLVGAAALANPIAAHAKLIASGLRICHDDRIDVIRPNRFRPEEHNGSPLILSPSEKRIIGDHLAAFAEHVRDRRAGFTDGGRRRDIVDRISGGQIRMPIVSAGWGKPDSSLYKGKRLSVIIPAQNEEKTLVQVIREARKIEPLEIIVVVNGSSDSTAKLAIREGAKTIYFNEALGNDTGRAIGAMASQGDILLFIDADFAIEAPDLYPYAKAVAEGVDVALNDLNHYLFLRFPLNVVTSFKYAVNLALDRKGLGVGSMVAVPHAVSRKALICAGSRMLVSPVAAQANAILHGCTAECVYRTEVDKMNKIRPDQHFSLTGYSPAVARIMGDHAEALVQIVETKGPRGPFPDFARRLDKLQGIR
ncbi:glycosyltransferase [Paenibacillus thermotolerans]|uniref:glycosyltransferase n=1 Tax=Paenibacillus thermotolerans TaxID=3027807 RepID=UPI00236787D4|nr:MULTISPECIES: glycosyltransferase [unclassified Paenibacillus]